ncbi:hypothetical protein L210DRAFT_3557941 [Boletus edulis BED1]|uniref:Uncharacterized protein n=1 Tax=Boletus edulis BED1 TaxID=1328754 RepID=A0AAD4G9P9_BOLED|nr:hypothetical protein L210DRAFT_3557941 [Boletus edulis BED1]
MFASSGSEVYVRRVGYDLSFGAEMLMKKFVGRNLNFFYSRLIPSYSLHSLDSTSITE